MDKNILLPYIEKVNSFLSPNVEFDGTRLNLIYEVILQSAMELSGADEGAVLSVNYEFNCLRIENWRGPGVDQQNHIIYLDEPKSNCAWAVNNKESKIINNIKNSQFLAISASKIESELVVPVLSFGIPIGVINLESFSNNHFNKDHQTCINDFCQAISYSWELAKLMDWKTRIATQLEKMSVINKALLNGSTDSTLYEIEKVLHDIMCAEIADILLLDEEKNNLIIHANNNIKDENKGKPIKKGTGIVWRCVEEKKMQYISDVSGVIKDGSYLAVTKKKMRSMIATPLILDDEVIGVINVESEKLNNFSLEDAQLLKLFGDQALVAINNARLLVELDASKSLASLGSITGNLAHRMNNLVGGIRVLSGFLANDLASESPDMAKIARKIELDANEALGTIDQYRKMFVLTNEMFDLIELVNQVISKIDHPDSVTINTLSSNSSIQFYGSHRQMEELINEIVRNALKSIGKSGRIEINIEETKYSIRITISDDGKGIPENTLNEIFKLGYKNRDTTNIGMGFGLWWADNYVRSLGGHLSAHNQTGSGAVFTAIFPKKNLPVGKKE